MPVQRKVVAVGASLLTHLFLLWALLPHALKPQIEAGVMSASLFDGDALNAAAPSQPALQAPPTERPPEKLEVQPDIEPLPVADTLPPVDATAEPADIGSAVSAQVAAAATAATASEGDRCAVGEWLQAALRGEPSVQAALATIPRSSRSVANAVMLWNGGWPPSTAQAAPGMARLRALVVAGIASAPDSCQIEPINGPVLIAVGDPADATVLAVGSGQWRWRDLLSENQQMQ